MRRVLQGIIWDLDGTLADTLQDISDAADVALTSAGLPTRPTSEYRRFVGAGLQVLLERASGLTDPAAIKRLIDAFREHYRRHGLDHTRLYEGIPEVLSYFTRTSVPMAILSNKPHEYTRMTVDALLSSWSFVAVLGQTDEFPKKPDATAALSLAARMGLSPAEVAMIGDGDIDVATARNAGFYPIAVTWGFRDREELVRAGARRIVSQPKELIPLIGRELEEADHSAPTGS